MPMLVYISIVMIPFSIVSFLFDPVLQQTRYGGEGVDLYRLFECLDLIRCGVGTTLLDDAPLSLLYFQIIADMFENNHFLPLISTWIFYFISFYLLLTVCKRFNADDNTKKIVIFFYICNQVFFGVFNSIRYPIAMIVFFAIFLLEKFKGKKIKIFYIIPILIHPGIVMVIIIRLLGCLKCKYSFTLLLLLCGGFFLYLDDIIQLMINSLSFFPELQLLLLNISMKFYQYSSSEIYEVPLLMRLTSLYVFFQYICLLAIAYVYKSRLVGRKIFVRMSWLVIILVTVGEITNYMNGNFADRIIAMLPFWMSVLTVDIFTKIQKENYLTQVMIKLFVVGNAMAYLSIFLFRIYFNWLYNGI